MKKFFALLVLGFLTILVEPVQAVQTNDYGFGYNINNVNAPPGEAVFAITSQDYIAEVIMQPMTAIYPMQEKAMIFKNFLPVQYAALARNAVNLTSETVNYSYSD